MQESKIHIIIEKTFFSMILRAASFTPVYAPIFSSSKGLSVRDFFDAGLFTFNLAKVIVIFRHCIVYIVNIFINVEI